MKRSAHLLYEASQEERLVSSFNRNSSHVISSADRFETLTEGIFSTCSDFAFKKMTEPLNFSISSESVSSHNCLTRSPCVRVCSCGKSVSLFLDLSEVIRNLLRVRAGIVAAVSSLMDEIWIALGVDNRL